MDNLYLLLITNRASNIVEDLETLRLLSKGDCFIQDAISFEIINLSSGFCSHCIFKSFVYAVVPDVAGTSNNLTEEKITEKCFELMFAFDEVITAGGYREPITLQQIRTNMDMESHEEKLHNMIKISKMESAKDQARDAARVIRDRQREQQRMGVSSGMAGIGGGGMDTSSGGSATGSSNCRLPNTKQTVAILY